MFAGSAIRSNTIGKSPEMAYAHGFDWPRRFLARIAGSARSDALAYMTELARCA